MRSLVAALAAGVGVGTAACLATPPPAGAPVDASIDAVPVCVDVDGDGWRGNCPTDAFQDCADGDPAVHPGAVEVGSVGATVDRDCTGAGVSEVAALVDLTVQPLGGGGPGEDGARVSTRFGRYDLDPRAGHQLTSVLVRADSGTLSPELLYDGPMAERNSGVHVWDDFLAVLPDDSSLVQMAAGPAIYQGLVTYRDGGTALDPSLSGTSLYTITMDGRIHRTDRTSLTEQPAYSGGSDFPGVTSHVALAAAAAGSGLTTFSHVAVRDGTTLRSEILPTTGPGTPMLQPHPADWRWSCAYGTDVEVGFTRVVPTTIGQPTRGTRIYANVTPTYRQVALQYDWQVGIGSPPMLDEEPMRGHFLITPLPRSGGECELVEAKSNAFTTPVDVALDGGSGVVVTSMDDDEDDDGFVEAGGYWALRANAPSGIRFHFEQPAGTTLPLYATFRIAGVPPGRDPVLRVDGNVASQGGSYRIQPDGADGIWLVLMFGASAGQEIELIYPPA